ncbi:TetR/AcrR family transcriptional regulator [Actinomycetospora atypica]|uniref:TetR/AcrR family transcriptional regulator n=1 Tax=Actinomycetospora atypica TaxID=1290095 RepID=A0ABV9YTA7_9PSEU
MAERAPAAASSRARPRDRRVQIAERAGELFSAHGFHSVRMDDIAKASGITARALYRHYDNKQALLSHVVIEDQERVVTTLTALAAQPLQDRDVDALLGTLVASALESRRLSVLWQREARHLTADDYERVRARTRWIAQQVEELVATAEGLPDGAAELRSWVVVSIISGHGFYDTTLSRRRLAQELVAACERVLGASATSPTGEPIPAAADRSASARREQLIHAAARSFRTRGFGGVSIDDIGREVGVVGPALYRYFDTKADLLVAAVARLHEWQALEARRALREPGPDEAVIAELVRSYVRLALEATDLVAVALTEWLYLPTAVLEHFDRVRADLFGEWHRWLAVARPDLPDAQVPVLVNIARTIIDDCVRIPNLRRQPTFSADLATAALAALGVHDGRTGS